MSVKSSDRTIDLAGRYVIPPIGDGHTHSFDGPFGFPSQREHFLNDGVFYAMTMTAPSTGVVKIRERLHGPKNVDVATAMGAFTGPDSHPAEIYEANALGYYTYPQQVAHADEIHRSRRMADDAYFVVRNKTDVDRKWQILRTFRPDLVKVFLRFSDRYKEGWGKWGAGGGIDPKLLPYIVSLARRAGLRTAVATSDRYDFERAVRSGAAIVTHPPCYQDFPDSGPYMAHVEARDCLISGADARLAGRRRVTTVLITSEWSNDRRRRTVEWEQANVRQLRRFDAPLAIGSDAYGSTPVDGLIAAAAKNLYPAAAILRWATMATPRMIFPRRRVGCLEQGCEASFLVLDRNPLVDMSALKGILLRVKDGEPLIPQEYQASGENPGTT